MLFVHAFTQCYTKKVAQICINQLINGLLSIATLDAGLHKHSKTIKHRTR